MALGIYLCDHFNPDLPQNSNLGTATSPGIHTHGDGLIHVEALNSTETGAHATVGKFFSEYPGTKLTSNSITLPTASGVKTFKTGDKCGSKAATLKAVTWDSPTAKKSKEVIGNIADVPLRDQHLITIGFVPNGVTLQKPPSVKNLQGAAQRENPPTSSTTAPGGATTTTAPATSTTTAAPGTTTTTKKP
jgi:hypothetical protein